MRSILDPEFEYTPAAQTDLKKTFARVRREQRAQDARNDKAAAEAALKVAPIQRRANTA